MAALRVVAKWRDEAAGLPGGPTGEGKARGCLFDAHLHRLVFRRLAAIGTHFDEAVEATEEQLAIERKPRRDKRPRGANEPGRRIGRNEEAELRPARQLYSKRALCACTRRN